MFNLCQDIHIIHEHHHFYHEDWQKELPRIKRENEIKHLISSSAEKLKVSKFQLLSQNRISKSTSNSSKSIKNKSLKGIEVTSKRGKSLEFIECKEAQKMPEIEEIQKIQKQHFKLNFFPSEKNAASAEIKNKIGSPFFSSTNSSPSHPQEIIMITNHSNQVSSTRVRFGDHCKQKLGNLKQLQDQISEKNIPKNEIDNKFSPNLALTIHIKKNIDKSNCQKVFSQNAHSNKFENSNQQIKFSKLQPKRFEDPPKNSVSQVQPFEKDRISSSTLHETLKMPLKYIKKSSLQDAISIVSRNVSESNCEDNIFIDESFVINRSINQFSQIS